MFGALTSLTGGGGLSASSSAAGEQANDTNQNFGGVHVGGLTMGPPPSAIDSEMIVKGAVIVGVGLAVVWAFKKM